MFSFLRSLTNSPMNSMVIICLISNRYSSDLMTHNTISIFCPSSSLSMFSQSSSIGNSGSPRPGVSISLISRSPLPSQQPFLMFKVFVSPPLVDFDALKTSQPQIVFNSVDLPTPAGPTTTIEYVEDADDSTILFIYVNQILIIFNSIELKQFGK